jgi:flagellar biosynthesis protein FlhG
MVRTIAIASGKGGVGKSSVSVNCSVLLSKLGYKVALLDADFGMANCHIMLDQKVDNSLHDVLENGAAIEKIIYETASGVKLIPGGSGILELLNLDASKRWQIINALTPLESDIDFLIVDTPAGGSDASIEFAAACENLVVVLVGEPTSFMDAYSFIKAMYIEKNYARISVLVNLSASESDAKRSYNSFKDIVTKFLDVELEYAGWLPNSSEMKNSILTRKPVVLQNKPNDKILNKNFNDVAKHIENLQSCSLTGIQFFSS